MRIRRQSDEALQAEREQLATELRAVEVRSTLEQAEANTREWASVVSSRTPGPGMLASIALGGGGPEAFGPDFIRDVFFVAFWEAFEERLAQLAVDVARGHGAMPAGERDAEIKRLRAALDEADTELKRRGIEARRAALEAELAELAGGVGQSDTMTVGRTN